MVAKIGEKAPSLKIAKWVQGIPTNIEKEKDNVVLVEVFQVNCPGCFIYGIPEAMEMYKKYHKDGLTVLGMATAFEDFDKNTLENLELLLTTGETIGDTLNSLGQYGRLNGKILSYKIPFPVSMDSLRKTTENLNQEKIMDVINSNIPDFESYNSQQKGELTKRVREYLKSKEYSAETFEEYSLRGTPSSILIDKKGILRDVSFGQNGLLENRIKSLLNE